MCMIGNVLSMPPIMSIRITIECIVCVLIGCFLDIGYLIGYLDYRLFRL